MTETVLSLLLVTYASVPSKLETTPVGPEPTGTIALAVFVLVSTIVSVPSPKSATNSGLPNGLKARAYGELVTAGRGLPTSTLDTTVFDTVSMTQTIEPAYS